MAYMSSSCPGMARNRPIPSAFSILMELRPRQRRLPWSCQKMTRITKMITAKTTTGRGMDIAMTTAMAMEKTPDHSHEFALQLSASRDLHRMLVNARYEALDGS